MESVQKNDSRIRFHWYGTHASDESSSHGSSNRTNIEHNANEKLSVLHEYLRTLIHSLTTCNRDKLEETCFCAENTMLRFISSFDMHYREIIVSLTKIPRFKGMRTLICHHYIVSLTSKVEVIFNTPALFDSRERQRATEKPNCAG